MALDALRGIALLGVLLVNLHDGFRISLAEHLLATPTDTDLADRTTIVLIRVLLEFKAFTVFSWLFGVGIAVFSERAAARQAGGNHFLVRRLLVLFVLGLGHEFLIWNGDILTLYAVCGFLLIPCLRLSPSWLASVGVAAIALPCILPLDIHFPSENILRGLALEARRVYSEGSFGAVRAFQWSETRLLIVPLLAASVPKTLGLMALGASAWRFGILREPQRHRGLLWGTAIVGGTVGGSATISLVYSDATGAATAISRVLLEAASYVPLALAYTAGLLLTLQVPSTIRIVRPFVAIGQMALTNYLLQSVILSLVFHPYGLGLYGRLGAAEAVLVGMAIYVAEVAFSLAWLSRHRFGPIEWLWRSLTYGFRPAMRLPH